MKDPKECVDETPLPGKSKKWVFLGAQNMAFDLAVGRGALLLPVFFY